nr:hypothetical protein [Tanacetum cinerariifolium]
MIMKLFRSDDKMSHMLMQLESQPEFGSESGSDGCVDDEPGDDKDGGEDKDDEFYGFVVKRESARDVYSKRRIIVVTELKIVEWHSYKHLDWITNKDKKNRLMRIDELHKFSDGTLTYVRTALDDRLKGIRMQYLPQSIWRKSDKDRAAAMIHAIDKRLKTRRIMRSLERFVGGRLYEGDFRMLQRTI